MMECRSVGIPWFALTGQKRMPPIDQSVRMLPRLTRLMCATSTPRSWLPQSGQVAVRSNVTITLRSPSI